MSVEVKIVITGDKKIKQGLLSLSSGLLNFSTAFRQIGRELKDYASNEVFGSQGGILGYRWPRLARSTVTQKLKKYPTYATAPLIATGKMRKNFQANSNSQGVIISNKSPQFPYHNSTAPRNRIPYRPMLRVNDDTIETVRRIIQQDVANKIKRAGLR